MFGKSNAMLTLVLLFLHLSSAWSDTIEARQRTFFAMGSKLQIESDRDDYFYAEASKSLHNFEKHISTWNYNSRLSYFNQTSHEWVQFDQQAYKALKNSLACSKLSNGYFHPGIGQLIHLWGLRTVLSIPSSKNKQEALLRSNLSELEFNDVDFKIKKSSKYFWFEEGGFAKGAALDSIVDLARKSKAQDLLLNFSGQVFSLKKKEIGIADPENRERTAAFVDIENESLSTSSIGVQHFSFKNKIYGHIINPKTGNPLSHSLKSLSVIHPENAWADCLSTGLLVMSENKEEFRNWLVDHPKIKVILLEKKEGQLFAETSCGLKKKLRTDHSQKVSQINENC